MARSRASRRSQSNQPAVSTSSKPADTSPLPDPERKAVLLVAFGLALGTLAIYSATVIVPFDFVAFDDQVYIAHNKAVMTGLNAESIRWAFTNEVAGNWHPLTILSHMLDVELYGSEPRGHHFTGILFHAANGVLLFLVLRSMTGALWPSAFVAAMFAWHPLRVESVAWVSERKDVLSTFFLFLALAAYTRYARRGSWMAYAALLLSFALGLMAKPMLVTFPFLLVLLDVWPLRRFGWRQPGGAGFPAASLWQVVVEKLPLVMLTIIFIATTLHAQSIAMSEYPVTLRVQNALVSYVVYIKQMFVPYPLYLPYLYVERPLSSGLAFACAAVLLAITGVVVSMIARRPHLALGWFWYLGTLVPVIGIVQVGEQAMADRYTYVPLIGLSIMLAWSLQEIAARSAAGRRATVAFSTAALVLLAGASVWQVSLWRDTETLFGHTIRHSPQNHIAYTSLATQAYYRKDYEATLLNARKALECQTTSRNAVVVMAQALARSGKTGEALAAYQQAIPLSPNEYLLLNELARILATCDDARFRNGQSAVRLARMANDRAGGQNPAVLDTLAAGYAEMGAWDQAIQTATAAHNMARLFVREGAADAQPLVQGLERRLALYRQHKPFRAPLGVWEY